MHSYWNNEEKGFFLILKFLSKVGKRKATYPIIGYKVIARIRIQCKVAFGWHVYFEEDIAN